MESDNAKRSISETVANFGAVWILIYAAAAPFVFWRMGEPVFGCIISPVVVIICSLPICPIVLVKGWKKLFLNWHAVALAVGCFFWWKHGNEIIDGPFRAASIANPTTIVSNDGRLWTIEDYVPFAQFDNEIATILRTRLIGERLSTGDVRSAAREIVSRGYAAANHQKLDKWERISKKQKYGNWGGRTLEMDGLDYSKLVEKYSDN